MKRNVNRILAATAAAAVLAGVALWASSQFGSTLIPEFFGLVSTHAVALPLSCVTAHSGRERGLWKTCVKIR